MVNTHTRAWQMLAIGVVICVLIWLLGPVLTPFIVAALLAWLGDPLVDRLEAVGRSRTTSVVIVYTLMILILVLIVLLLVPLLEREIVRLVQSWPRYQAWFVDVAVPWVEDRLNLEFSDYVDPTYLFELVQSHWQQAGGVAATILGTVSRSGMAVVLWAVNLVLIPIVTFYFLRDWDVMVARVREMLPRSIEPTVVRLARESDAVLGGFIRGQVAVMFALGALYAIGLWLIGIDMALIIGVVTGLTSFVPYLGATLGLVMGAVAALVQHGDWTHLLLVGVVYTVVQLAESYVLTPRLVGDRIGLHPVAVIFAVMAFGQLFGFIGVLVALPVAAVTMVLLRFGYERYTASELYGGGMLIRRPGEVDVVEADTVIVVDKGDGKTPD
ncbi:AI-2E family transporter [Coralloluteibacterium stylophorae]|uniref:AI-2E family transporter n=1 Tax=Coralloluteibacterium stylophorae TaxID=1776034 RepID=A0A8J7VUJ1_9GAMM|nr:AI-2E family transporter [Coralloluteibacterium stylophorae]MBS7456728.1 AI-2E family transporter [Coralloluteibacterium stylophorae]